MSIEKEFQSILGKPSVVTKKSDLSQFSIDGLVPKAVLYPKNEEEISEVMKFASRKSIPILPIGSGTKRSIGNILKEPSVLLSTSKLNHVLEHESRDLVATAQCGITVKELQKTLGKSGQFLPVDPMYAQSGATLGGIIASNASGPLRLRYGTLRELILGIKVVRSDGTIFKGGSKVVKNVAGYDLPKLFVGSLGTLGIITEATLRLYPIQDKSQTYLVSFTTLEKCADTVSELLKSELVLNSLELLNPALVTKAAEHAQIELNRKKYALAIRVMNVDQAVNEQIALVKKVCNKNRGQGIVLESNIENALWEGIINLPWTEDDSDRVKIKCGVKKSDVPGIFVKLEELTKDLAVKSYSSAKAGNGVVDITLSGEAGDLLSIIEQTRAHSKQKGGSLVIEEAALQVKQNIDVWGDMGSALSLMKRIKSNFDPAGILNPGRFI